MHYKSMEEVKALRIKFERGTLSLEDWSHRAYLALCCWYLTHHPRRAEGLLREGIQSLHRANGVISTARCGYHETLTLFWIAKVRGLLDVCEGKDLAVLNAVVGGLENEDLVLFHFSHERITSSEARLQWCEPDLHPLPTADESHSTWVQKFQARDLRCSA